MANGDKVERRVDIGEMATHITEIRTNSKHILQTLGEIKAAQKEDRDKSDAVAGRVIVLETNQKELKRVARSDKIIDRVGIIATAIAAYFGIRT